MDQNASENQVSNTKTGGIAAQFSRFVVVGLINSVINFTVLNVLSWLTGISSGPQVIIITVIAFAAATTNSYFLNKHWTFKDPSTSDVGVEFSKFLMVSIIGATINSAAVYLITTHIDPLYGLSAKLWLNVANACGIGLGLIWNFYGYRKFVFKDR